MLNRPLCAAAAVLLSLPSPAQDAERALLLVDPNSAESLYVANYYLEARGVPASNVLYMTPSASSYPTLTSVQLPAFLGGLANGGIEDQVDFVVLPPGPTFYVSAPGLINDMCFPVNRFALPSAYALARQSADILGGGLGSNADNHYKKNGWGANAFQGALSWRFGDPSTHPEAERYLIGAMLGWTGQNGNTLQEVLDTIDRSVAADFTHPVGTAYYMQTTDVARSSPRHDSYPTAVTKLQDAGGQAQHLFADLPLGNHDCMGVMTGRATLPISDPSFSLLPGSFADHLTSFAATFDNNSQTKMTEWITKGASGTAGTVEEPCNYPGKFPAARIHVVYFKGLTLGEAWFRSAGSKPFQGLFLGDPLTRPYGNPPTVDVPSPPAGPVSGTIGITPVAAATEPGAGIDVLELLVDGVRVDSVPDGGSFTLDTTTLADGWHDLRVRAFDDVSRRNVGRWIGELVVDNAGHAVTLSAPVSSGDLGTLFDLSHAASGGAVSEVVLLHNGRVVAASSAANGTMQVYGQNLGGHVAHVQAEARFTTGPAARSAPVTLDVAYSGGGASGQPPVAFSFTRRVRDDVAFVLELPGVHDSDPAGATTAVVTPPSHATVLGGAGAWRSVQPVRGVLGTDSLTYQVTTSDGTSSVGTITLEVYDGDPCDLATRYCVAAPNSVGPGALIGHEGSLSVAANDLVLTVSGCPPNQFGLFFYGKGQVQNQLADGFMCVGSNHVRFGALQLDGAGAAEQPIDYPNPPQPSGLITAGSTWDFQFWYRDPPFGSFGSNFSDAIEATFCP